MLLVDVVLTLPIRPGWSPREFEFCPTPGCQQSSSSSVCGGSMISNTLLRLKGRLIPHFLLVLAVAMVALIIIGCAGDTPTLTTHQYSAVKSASAASPYSPAR